MYTVGVLLVNYVNRINEGNFSMNVSEVGKRSNSPFSVTFTQFIMYIPVLIVLKEGMSPN